MPHFIIFSGNQSFCDFFSFKGPIKPNFLWVAISENSLNWIPLKSVLVNSNFLMMMMEWIESTCRWDQHKDATIVFFFLFFKFYFSEIVFPLTCHFFKSLSLLFEFDFFEIFLWHKFVWYAADHVSRRSRRTRIRCYQWCLF